MEASTTPTREDVRNLWLQPDSQRAYYENVHSDLGVLIDILVATYRDGSYVHSREYRQQAVMQYFRMRSSTQYLRLDGALLLILTRSGDVLWSTYDFSGVVLAIVHVFEDAEILEYPREVTQ